MYEKSSFEYHITKLSMNILIHQGHRNLKEIKSGQSDLVICLRRHFIPYLSVAMEVSSVQELAS